MYRSARKWWQALPTARREHFWEQVKARWYVVILAAAGMCGAGVVYYKSHTEETPVTGRQRYIAVTHEQFMKIARKEAETVRSLENTIGCCMGNAVTAVAGVRMSMALLFV